MGYYIQTPENLDKVHQIAGLYGGKIVPKPVFSDVPADKALVVVISNVIFEAAALVYDQLEFDAFHEPGDDRKKQYVLLDRATAHKLAGYKQ